MEIPPRWRCVLLAGPAGSGKTTLCRLGHRAMVAAWGHPAAAIDVDQLYQNVDARWELPYDDARNAMVLSQAAVLAASLFEHGWRTVVITGNSLFGPRDTAPVLATLCPVAEIYHVTLTPRLDVLLQRCAGDSGRDLARLRADYEIHARALHPGTVRLDTTNLTAEAALTELTQRISRGEGRIRCQLAAKPR